MQYNKQVWLLPCVGLHQAADGSVVLELRSARMEKLMKNNLETFG